MKKAIKQSALMYMLNIATCALLFCIAITFVLSSLNSASIAKTDNARVALTANANRFMNGSSYLTNEVRAYAAQYK